MYVAVRQLKHYSWAALLTATAVGCLVWAQPHANLTTTALVLVLVVTVSAIAWGSGPALITALLSVFCFNYFFIPPIHTFTIAEPQNWIRSEEHTSELQSRSDLVCRLLLEKKKKKICYT